MELLEEGNMLDKLEKKINNKILEEKNNIKNLKKEYNKNLDQELCIIELLNNIDNIKKSKKRKNIILLLNIITAAASIIINPWFLSILLLLMITYYNENSIIKENLNNIKNSEYSGSKNEKDLKESLNDKVIKNNNIKERMNKIGNRINEYKKNLEEIIYVKSIKSNVSKDDMKYKELKELYSVVPILAFDSKEEYDNYLSYDNEFIKDEIINSKVLSKHL